MCNIPYQVGLPDSVALPPDNTEKEALHNDDLLEGTDGQAVTLKQLRRRLESTDSTVRYSARYVLAQDAIKNGRVALSRYTMNGVAHDCVVVEQSHFITSSNKGALFTVRTTPKYQCFCRFQPDCFHILAAKIFSEGEESSITIHSKNHTQLCRLGKKRSVGKKGPVSADVVVTGPAPDSRSHCHSEEIEYELPSDCDEYT